MMSQASRTRLPVLAAMTLAVGLPVAAQTVVVDNVSPGFTQIGGYWALSTNGTQTFVGANHLASQGFSSAGIVDNSSVNFSSSAGWSPSTELPGFYGQNYLDSGQSWNSAIHLPEIVIDNDLYTSGYGNLRGGRSWPTASAISGYYGRDYSYLSPSTTGYPKVQRFTFHLRGYGNLSNSSLMTLKVRWPADAANATNAVIRLRDTSPQPVTEYVVNQQEPSGEWFTLGNVNLVPGQTYYVEFDAANANGRVIADAIKVVTADVVPPKTAKWRITQPPGLYDAYVRTPAAPWGAAFGAWSVVGATGTDYLAFPSQQADGGGWRKIGRLEITGSQENYVLLEHFGSYGGSRLFADAVMTVPRDSFPTVRWSANVTGSFRVYASWAAHPSRTYLAKYKVYTYGPGCMENVQTVIVDQRNSFSAPGLLLGNFTNQSQCFPPVVELSTDLPGATLSADAITFVK